MNARTAALDEGARTEARVGDYIALLKPRVMSLVVFTGLAGLVVAPGHLHPLLAAVAVLCIAVSAGAAGAINMWYDRYLDAVRSRRSGGRGVGEEGVRTGRLRGSAEK